MAINTTNMILRTWDESDDNFSYTELAANWGKVDVHDHTTGKGVQVPTDGIVNLAITGPKIATGAITDATKIVDGIVTDAKLASPNGGAYKTIVERSGQWSGALSANQVVIIGNGSPTAVTIAAGAPAQMAFYVNPASYVVAGKILKFRINSWIWNSTLSTASTWSVDLAQVTNITSTGTVQTGTTQFNSVGVANSGTSIIGAGTDFTPLAAGLYVFSVHNPGSGTGLYTAGAKLEYRHV